MPVSSLRGRGPDRDGRPWAPNPRRCGFRWSKRLQCRVVELNPTNMEQALSIITTDGEALRLFALRGKLITYLLGCGVPPQRFRPTQGLLLERAVSMSTNRDISDRTRRNMIFTVTLLVHAVGTMSEVYGLSDTERRDLLSIAANIGSFANTIERTLGWGTEEGKPST